MIVRRKIFSVEKYCSVMRGDRRRCGALKNSVGVAVILAIVLVEELALFLQSCD